MSVMAGYRTVWRWHFYAGLVCIPFVLWLSVTGSIYLFKPQIEAWLDRPYEHLAIRGTPTSAANQVNAALAAVPGSVLNAYELPQTPQSAVRVLVGHQDHLMRVYVHPETLAVLNVVNEDDRFMRFIFRLHGELMQGDRGSMVVETAASWTIVMLLTGLFLWWPRGNAGPAGVVYPRLKQGGRVFWRDLHAVTGLWVSFFALFLLISGLPWAKSWGGMLKEVRQWGASEVVRQDWTTGRSSEIEQRRLANAPAATDVPDEHANHHGSHHAEGMASAPPTPADYRSLDTLVTIVAAERLLPPVLIAPPSGASPRWTARSDTQNRPQRSTLTLDAESHSIVSRKGFASQPFIDRAVAVGVAAHEGQLFAPMNQVLGLFTTAGLTLLSISAIQMWWRRRPVGVLGAPVASQRPKFVLVLYVLIGAFGILLPLLGATLLAVLVLEWLVLRRVPAVSRFLGLTRPIQQKAAQE